MCLVKKTKKYPLDFSDVCCVAGMHSLLKKTFSFPEYYGANWDAFYDCLTDALHGSAEIRIKGIEHVNEAFPRESAIMLEVMRDVAAEKNTDGSEVRVVVELSDGTERELSQTPAF